MPQIDPATGERIKQPMGATASPQIDPATGERVKTGANLANAASGPGTQSTLQKFGSFAGDVGKGLGESAVSLMSTGDDAVRRIPHIGEFLTTPITGTPADKAIAHTHALATPANTTQAVSKGVGDAAQFMIPGQAEEMGAAKLASLAPKLGKAALPLAKIGTSALSSGLVNKAQGGDFGTGAMAGAGGAALGQGLKAAAPAVAETALKVRGNQRLFGRTVGDAILNDTRGIRPATIGKSAQSTIGALTPELDAADQASAASGARGSLIPARDRVAGTIAGHSANRAVGTAADLQPVSDFLQKDQLTGLPLSPNQSAPGLRAMKRGINSDFIGKWSPDQPAAQKGAARAAYGDINQQLHGISPETAGIDQRISSLIPVAQQGERVASQAPTLQRVMGRFSHPTGALFGAGAGATAGYREGGAGGAVAGGLTGLIAPELIASPEGQMILARSLNHAGTLRPVVGAALQADRKKEQK